MFLGLIAWWVSRLHGKVQEGAVLILRIRSRPFYANLYTTKDPSLSINFTSFLEPPFPYSFPFFGRGHLHNHHYSLSSKSPALIVQLYTCAPVRKDQKHAEGSFLFTLPRKSKKRVEKRSTLVQTFENKKKTLCL